MQKLEKTSLVQYLAQLRSQYVAETRQLTSAEENQSGLAKSFLKYAEDENVNFRTFNHLNGMKSQYEVERENRGELTQWETDRYNFVCSLLQKVEDGTLEV